MSGNFKKSLIDGIILFFGQLLMYSVATINYRSIAQADYLFTGLSAGVMAFVAFLTIKILTKKTEKPSGAWIGYVLGSVSGDLIGILISKYLLGS